MHGVYTDHMESCDTRKIILFDGLCGLCNRYVRFVMKRDSAGKFYFAAQDSSVGKSLIEKHGLQDLALKAIILIDEMDGRVYVKSKAVLQIAALLDGSWPILSVFSVLPRIITDSVYDFVASHRYKWFGKLDSCPVPTPEEKKHFL